jgi:hypothetical protein
MFADVVGNGTGGFDGKFQSFPGRAQPILLLLDQELEDFAEFSHRLRPR